MNLINAISDPHLYGESLIVPLKLSVQAFQHTFSPWPANLSLDKKIVEVFKRSALLIASLGSILALPLALIGVAIK